MKTIVIGDIHGRDIWEKIISKEDPNRVIFIGDYFDSFDISVGIQLSNFQKILQYKKETSIDVKLLIGNHDFHYFPGGEIYSGFNHASSFIIRELLYENRSQMQMCYQLDNILFSHAGIGHNWLVNQRGYEGEDGIAEFVNDMWVYKPDTFRFNGRNPYGDSTTQSPIWIRPNSLMSGNKNTFLNQKYIQVVGHTQVNNIDIEGKSTGGKYFFIDALHANQYLIYENEQFYVGELVS